MQLDNPNFGKFHEKVLVRTVCTGKYQQFFKGQTDENCKNVSNSGSGFGPGGLSGVDGPRRSIFDREQPAAGFNYSKGGPDVHCRSRIRRL